MQKLMEIYHNKYLADMSEEEIEEDWIDIQIGIYCILIGFVMVVLGGIL